MELLTNIVNRWATSDGSLTFACYGTSATARCGEEEATVNIQDGRGTISYADVKRLLPEIGAYELVIESDSGEFPYNVERVGNRYTDKQTIIEYGRKNSDEFDNAEKYTDADFAACILAAEDSIEKGCGNRSFCRRKMKVILRDPKLNELPVVDVFNIESKDGNAHLVSYCQAEGVEDETEATITFGVPLNAKIAMAATMLAASFMRPRATPENARGTAQEGVYISYELPTGEEGSWTGLPKVDAAIEEYRARRVMIG